MEQVTELLEDRRQELNEGIAPRALARRIDEHLKDHDELDRRLRELESAFQARRAVSDFRMEVQTGRHPIVTEAFMPAAPPVPKRHTMGLVRAVVKGPAGQWFGVVLIVIASHVLTKCGVQPPPAPAAAVGH